MKTYTNRSNARRAAIANLFNAYKADDRFEGVTKEAIQANFDKLCFVTQIGEAEFAIGNNDNVDNVMLDLFECKIDKEYRESYGVVHCPHCGIHLSNGVISDDNQACEGLPRLEKHEFECMACGEEFGPLLKPRKAKKPAAPRKAKQKAGIKIEKNRAKAHGVTRPSAGGVCAAIWEFCDVILENENRIATAADLRAEAEKQGWDQTTTRIQMYRWRKHNGVSGRQ